MDDKLVIENLRLVDYVVKTRFKNIYHVEYEDLIQFGRMGLVLAAKNFKPDYGVKFITYAIPSIAGTIQRNIRKGNEIKIDNKVRTVSHKMHLAKKKLENRYNRAVSVEEIANELGIEIKAAFEANNCFNSVMSLNVPCVRGETDTFECNLSDGSDFTEELCLKIDILRSLNVIFKQAENDRFETFILEYFYSLLKDDKLPQNFLAKKYGLSQLHVSRTIRKYTDLLKDEITSLGYFEQISK